MVMVLTIRDAKSALKAKAKLDRMVIGIPSWNSKAMMKWGKTLERDMKNSAKLAGIQNSTGELLSTGIQYRQRPRGRVGRLFILQRGVYLDSMRPHFVNITRSRTRLLAWASRSRNFGDEATKIRNNQLKSHTIFVRPHPFIDRGYKRSRPKLKSFIKTQYERGMRTL